MWLKCFSVECKSFQLHCCCPDLTEAFIPFLFCSWKPADCRCLYCWLVGVIFSLVTSFVTALTTCFRTDSVTEINGVRFAVSGLLFLRRSVTWYHHIWCTRLVLPRSVRIRFMAYWSDVTRQLRTLIAYKKGYYEECEVRRLPLAVGSARWESSVLTRAENEW